MSSIEYLRVVNHYNIGDGMDRSPKRDPVIGLRSNRHFIMTSCMSSTDGVRSSLGVLWRLGRDGFQSALRARTCVSVGIAAPIGDRKCLEATLPLSSPGNGLATTQLCPADGEERQLHGRAQAREFSGSKLTKRRGLRIVVGQDAVSLLYSNRRSVTAGAQCKREKEPP